MGIRFSSAMMTLLLVGTAPALAENAGITSVAEVPAGKTAAATATGATNRNTYRVGPSRAYKDLTAVQAVLAPGDTVLVDGNATYPSVVITMSGAPGAPITFEGVRVSGARPIISGGTNALEVRANDVVVTGFEITGGSARCFFHHGDHVMLSHSVVHDCPDGVLGADSGSGSLTLQFVEIYRCGSGTQRHSVYMATNEVDHPGSVFRMQHCYIHDGTGGHAVKSRSERNEIYYNWVEGGTYREFELIGPDPDVNGNTPMREDSDVVGNVVWHRSIYPVIRVGTDRAPPAYDGSTRGRYRFVNNTIIITGSAAVFQVFGGVESIEAHNNVLYASAGTLRVLDTAEAAWESGSAVAGTNNWVSAGSTYTPGTWTGTRTGSSPGFTDLARHDLTPTKGSPLVDAGGSAPAYAAHPFVHPLYPPIYVPPAHALGTSATARPLNGAIDIGAYEYAGRR